MTVTPREVKYERSPALDFPEHQDLPTVLSYDLVAGPRDSSYPLPLEVERSLADDFAFIAAFQPSVGFVTAATVEQSSDNPSLVVKLAANEGVSAEVRSKFDEMLEMLRKHARKGIPSKILGESASLTVYQRYQPGVLSGANS